MCSLGIEPTTFCTADAMLHTEPHRNTEFSDAELEEVHIYGDMESFSSWLCSVKEMVTVY